MVIDLKPKGYNIYTTPKKTTNIEQSAIITLRASIREKAQDTANIAFSDHARERIIERGILLAEIVRVLTDGQFSQPVTTVEKASEHRFQLSHILAGREIVVHAVCQIDLNGGLFVITVFEITMEIE